jgi:hypothetical protein
MARLGQVRGVFGFCCPRATKANPLNALVQKGVFCRIWGNIGQQTGKASGNITKHDFSRMVNNLLIYNNILNEFERRETP